MKTVLFPTDFSPNAEHAQKIALDLVRRIQGSLVLTHSIELPYDFASRREKFMEEKQSKALQKMKDRINTFMEEPDTDDLEFHTDVREASPLWGILEAARDFDADLIIMGTRGNAGLRNAIFGDVTTQVISESSIPVLSIPEKAETTGFDEIVFPTDYRDEDLNMLASLISIADSYKARIIILHVGRQDSLQDEIMFRGFREFVSGRVHFSNIEHKMIYGEDTYGTINGFMQQREKAILAVADYRKSFLDRLTGSEYNIVHWPELLSTLPLLIVKLQP